MELKKLNLVELNDQELNDIQGGFWLELLCLVVGIIVGVNLYDATH
jgi:lactobin A/cerein 7B family class IIb bacteriocin